MHRTLLILVAGLFGFSIYLAIAQEGGNDAPAPPDYVIVTSALGASDETFSIVTEEGVIDLEFPVLDRSEPLVVHSSPLIILRPGEGGDEPEPVAEIELSEDFPTLIIRVPPGIDEGAGSTFFSLPDDLDALYGTYRVVNLTGHELGGSVGDDGYIVPAGEHLAVGQQAMDEDPEPTPFTLWRMEEGEKQWIERKTIKPHPGKYLIFFYHALDPAPPRGRLRITPYGLTVFR